ncbi:MAG: acyltransferase family protein [Bdellovibrio sp.]|nr:acyltransferase family protein [Methylotenera sp.]
MWPALIVARNTNSKLARLFISTTNALKTTTNLRTLWVDYAKALGIMLVVYGHVTRGLYNAQIPMNENLFKLIDSIIYSFHMPLFFFLSGLFFYTHKRLVKIQRAEVVIFKCASTGKNPIESQSSP